MNSSSNFDDTIPVLTEIISVVDDSEPIFHKPADVNQAQPAHTPPDHPEQTEVNQKPSWEQLEKTLHENVLRQLLTRVDFVLEHRIRDSLADILEAAVDDLTKDIRSGLTKSLEEIIQRAISQEISKIQSINATPVKNDHA